MNTNLALELIKALPTNTVAKPFSTERMMADIYVSMNAYKKAIQWTREARFTGNRIAQINRDNND